MPNLEEDSMIAVLSSLQPRDTDGSNTNPPSDFLAFLVSALLSISGVC